MVSARHEVKCCPRPPRSGLQVTEQIRAQTGHLPGVAIAVMGCIVNGPGEMADADFGCVHFFFGGGQLHQLLGGPVTSAVICLACPGLYVCASESAHVCERVRM